jgi:hypothetical protein
MGQVRAARYRAERDSRARALGYADAADLLRQRYVVENATVGQLAAALSCAEITVTPEIGRLGIRRRPQQARSRRDAARWPPSARWCAPSARPASARSASPISPHGSNRHHVPDAKASPDRVAVAITTSLGRAPIRRPGADFSACSS